MPLDPIDVDERMQHPPEAVWRALTTPELLAQWLMENDFEPVVGHRFTMRGIPVPAVGFSGVVASEVLEIEEGKRLVISWRDAEGGNALASTVTFTVAPDGDGARLFIRHEGFDEADAAQASAHRIMSNGWRDQVLPRLTALLG